MTPGKNDQMKLTVDTFIPFTCAVCGKDFLASNALAVRKPTFTDLMLAEPPGKLK